MGVQVPHRAPNGNTHQKDGCFCLVAYDGRDLNPRGRDRKRECPVDILAGHGLKATAKGAEEEACKRSAAGGQSLIAHQTETPIKKMGVFVWSHMMEGT